MILFFQLVNRVRAPARSAAHFLYISLNFFFCSCRSDLSFLKTGRNAFGGLKAVLMFPKFKISLNRSGIPMKLTHMRLGSPEA